MKKLKFLLFIFLTLGAFFVGMNWNTGVAVSDTDMQNKYCPKKPFDIAGMPSRTVQAATGANFLAEKVAESTVKKGFNSFAKGNLSVKAKSFSVTDAKQGKFESFEINGRNIVANSVYISELWAKTVCGFVHFDLNSNPVKLKAPLLLDFSAKFTEADLNKMLQSPEYQKYLLSIKLHSGSLEFFALENPRISLKDNKFRFSVDVKVPFIRAFSFTTISDLEIESNKVKISNMKVGSTNQQLDISGLRYITNIFDPISFAQKALEQYHCKLFLKSVKIQEGKIIITGSVFIAKS